MVEATSYLLSIQPDCFFLNFYFYCEFLFLVRCIDDNKSRVIEGQLRCVELSTYLNNLNAVKKIWLAEDATAIIRKISYDPATNQLVGLLLPLNKCGCPISFSFLAKNADTIKELVQSPQSKSVYVIMAQALDETIPPFILQMFGTNNQFTALDVVRRWEYTKSQLEE